MKRFFWLAVGLIISSGLAVQTQAAETPLSSFVKYAGEGAGDIVGMYLAPAGDVDGDGYDDFLIGAPYNASVGVDSGAAYLIYGQTEALTSVSLADASVVKFSAESADDDMVGVSVSTAGDVNGDGYADFLIGAHFYDNETGRVYLLYGQAARYTSMSLSDSSVVALTGEATGDQAGAAVAAAGDVNADGYADFLIAAAGNDDNGNEAGAVYLVYGQAGAMPSYDLDALSAVEITGAAADDYLGTSLAGGDVNGDGYSDLIIGGTYINAGNSNSGAVYIIYGEFNHLSDLTVSDSSVVELAGEADSDYAANSVSGGQDVNGDGYLDILIGASGQDAGGTSAGAAYLIYGQADNLTSQSLATAGVKFIGEAAGDFAGYNLSLINDVNGDGYAELLIGAVGNDRNDSFAGSSFLVYGQADALAGGYLSEESIEKFYGEGTAEFAGINNCSAGDVNGDGLAEILVGAYYNGDFNEGAVYLGYLYLDQDGDGVPGSSGLLTGTDCNDSDSTVSSEQIYYEDQDGDGLGNANNSYIICSATPPDGYVVDNSDCNDNIKDIARVRGRRQGRIVIIYVNNDREVLSVFSQTTAKRTKVQPQPNQPRYYVALAANGRKMALINVYRLQVKSRQTLDSQTAYSTNALKLKKFRQRNFALAISKTSEQVLLSLVRINLTKKKLVLKDQIALTDSRIVPKKTIRERDLVL